MCIGYIIRMEFVTLVADVSLVENESDAKKFAAAVRAPSSGVVTGETGLFICCRVAC